MDSREVFQVLVGSIREVVPELAEHEFRREDQLAELGVASVERTEVVVMTLEALELNIPLVKTFGPRNLGELADLLAAKLGG